MERIEYQLDNGLDVILQPMATAPVIACNVWVGVGSADETPEEAGLAHVHEHMLFKGTDHRGVGEIARDVESAGGRINAFTSFDQTCYYVVLSSRFFDSALDILSDAVRHSSFEADELQRELEVIQEEIKRGEDNPARMVSRLLFETAFTAHPYRLPVIGTAESVDSFRRDDVVQFYHKHYVPQNMALILAGDFDVDDARRRIDDYFGDFDGSDYTSVQRPQEPPQEQLRVATDTRSIRQNHLRVGFHIPEVRHDDIPAIDLLSVILGYGDAAHLQRTLKRRDELVHRVFTSAYTPREPGLLVVGADFQNDDRDQTRPDAVARRLLEETVRFCNTDVTSRQLDRARTLVESQQIYGKQTVEGMAMKLGHFLMVAGDPGFEQDYYDALRAVEPADIRRVARRYLTVDNATLVHLGPDEEPVSDDDLRDAAHQAFDTAEPDDEQSASAVSPKQTVTRIDIDDGPTLLVQRNDSVQTFSIRAVSEGGTRFEHDEIAGMHKLLSRVITRGTPSRTAVDIADEIESMAASIDGLSGRNSFGLAMTGLTRFFDPCFDVFADCMLNADVPADEFERQRRLQLRTLSARRDKLAAVNHDQFTRAFFGDHPYSLPLLGTESTVDAVDIDDAKSVLQQRRDPRDMTIAVVGDVAADRVAHRIEEAFRTPGDIARNTPEVPPFQPVQRPSIVVGDLEKEQAHIIVGLPAPLISDDDVYALDLLYAVLSGQGGRLFYELRDRQSLAYSVYARKIVGLDASSFTIQIGTSPEKIERAIDGIRAQIDQLHNGAVSDEDLSRARRYLIGNHDIGLQKNSSRAMQFALNELYGLGYQRTLEYADHLQQVTTDDVRRLIDRWLTPDNMVVSVTKPPSIDVDTQTLGLEPIDIHPPTV